jgi:hypothetical protein
MDTCGLPACGGYSAYMWLNNTKTDDTHLSCNELCNPDIWEELFVACMDHVAVTLIVN